MFCEVLKHVVRRADSGAAASGLLSGSDYGSDHAILSCIVTPNHREDQELDPMAQVCQCEPATWTCPSMLGCTP